MAELLLALAIHSDESAFAILRPFLFALPPQTIMVLFTSADVRTKLLITPDDGVSEKVEEGVEDLLWWLHAKRLSHIVLTSDGADRDSITFAAESLLPTLIPHPDRFKIALLIPIVHMSTLLLSLPFCDKMSASVGDNVYCCERKPSPFEV